MTAIFLYGTLRHVPLLRAVTGQDVPYRAARLRDHVARHASGEAFPQIFREPGGVADGLLIDADDNILASLDFYEGAYGYALRPVSVETDAGTVAAQVYWPPDGTEKGALWDLQSWVDTCGGMTVSAAPDVMQLRKGWDAQASRMIRPFAVSRGWARQLAKTGAPAELRFAPRPDDLSVQNLPGGYMGFFGLRRIGLSHRRFGGAMTPRFEREVFMAFDAALVLPYDPDTDTVMLIEQLRFGPIVREDPNPWVLEPIAGMVDAGEDPETTVRREAVEEAGVALRDVIRLPAAYPSPGYSSEYFHMFVATADLSGHSTGLGGLAEESEDIRHHVIARSRALELVDSGEINAVPLQTLILWLERMRAQGRFDIPA